MRLFKKHQQKEFYASNTYISDKVAEKFALVGLCIQRKFSIGMNKIFGSLTAANLKLVLITFCLSAGGYSVYLIVSAANGKHKNQDALNITIGNISRRFISENNNSGLQNIHINDATINKIIQFKKYMDSLKNEHSYLYDSIINARPLLMDSVLKLETIYLSQKK